MKAVSQENPVSIEDARKQLSTGGKLWSRSRISAIKRAMGIESRWFFLSDVRKWLRANPKWKQTDVYPRRPKQTNKGA